MAHLNKSTPKILILLATYNGFVGLPRQISSILNQSKVDVHIVISDDHSDDRTAKYLREVNAKSKKIDVIFRDTGTGSAGQNFFGMFRSVDSRGFDYVALADQDDCWFENKLDYAVSCLETSECAAYSSSVTAVWSDGRRKVLQQSSSIRKADFLFEGAGQGCTFVISTCFFHEIQEFSIINEHLTNQFHYHDWYVYLLCRMSGKDWFFDARSTMNYLQHNENDTGARSGYRAFLKRIRLILSGWYKCQIIIAIEIARRVDPENEIIILFKQFTNNSLTFVKRLSYAILLLKHGRRKVSDRVVLCIASLFSFL